MRACRKYWLSAVISFFKTALRCIRTVASPCMVGLSGLGRNANAGSSSLSTPERATLRKGLTRDRSDAATPVRQALAGLGADLGRRRARHGVGRDDVRGMRRPGGWWGAGRGEP